MSKSFQTHPQAFYTSRLLNLKSSKTTSSISECLDVQLSELELNETCQDSEHNIE
ncbi:hypothetical protein C1646_758141 [Rhizophagus diaphanus]|nr:hypothetical protein C1646_758141 [Rhizophagus diaphanus] [Rhizophagus sp. MUCL 43196]